MRAATPLGVGALRLDARAKIQIVEFLEHDRTRECQPHGPKPYSDLALVGLVVDHFGEFCTRHAGRNTRMSIRLPTPRPAAGDVELLSNSTERTPGRPSLTSAGVV